jgi:hypothetical protein
MADGYDIHLTGRRAALLERAARAAGVTPAEYALQILDHAISEDWAATLEAFADYDSTHEFVPARQALAEFATGVEEDLVARGK